jgi:hypothetical protein
MASIDSHPPEDDVKGPCSPPKLSFVSREQFEARLMEGLNSPTREMADADWDQMKDRLRQRHARKRPHAPPG